ncbi:Sec63-domain-containing protein [Armillaria novae-zelandiae]|uniref:Sec63-domain-containing protein n=1 Tax=Armillaria novae-zelandiae TaxID=153914 RepID=A0AA39TIW4_9AGAR|nr:Sec63-domain-containing protein [Armillaria novae-zelandiae]
MPGLVAHLHFLLGGPSEYQDHQLITSWNSQHGQMNVAEVTGDGDLIDEPPTSVLDIYRHPERKAQSDVVSSVFLKPHGPSIATSLLSVLSSGRPSDQIQGELADIVGFDDIALVVKILNNRDAFVQELQDSLHEAPEAIRHHENERISGASNPQSIISSTGKWSNDLSAESARLRTEKTLRDNAARPLFTGIAQPEGEVLPHVYSSSSISQGNVLSYLGSKYMLPVDTTRQEYEEYSEVVIPPSKPIPPRSTERLIPVSELDPIARRSFPGYSSLNRIQSIVYPTAYRSNENMLVCAPTGAGKTDVAMMTILRVLDQHRSKNDDENIRATIDRDSFKIIYVAPMKALASEIVRKFSKRLQWLSIQIRELTGDMQMTKAEIAQTQIIVTTPEKWDVVTRKPTGEGELASLLKLLIIDEVHLLNEERGAVIETIVARTLRQSESFQSVIRIVGLSATLPNYIDVADFLSVSRYTGLFYFDSSFRPVPLEQHFLGIKGKPGSLQSRKNLDHVAFEKVSDLVAQGHQVMVFVHSRKDTVKTAMSIKEMAILEGNVDDFSCQDHPMWGNFRRDIGQSRNREMKQLFDHGFGIHHAGMLRSDRNMMERMFDARAIKVLCCTATLAWGVNLPAHAVIIKGTQVYDSSKGAFVDLSVLDVLQVFGRAGRPGLETSGEGYICTTEDRLTHYLEAITSQNPIESQFQRGMVDALNAEVSLGTVANTGDAVRWLGYTYLFVRMRKNPYGYGIPRESTSDDPNLGNKRNDLVASAAQKLVEARMMTYDRTTGAFTITDLGRIAAKYYIRCDSIEVFNKEFRPKMSEADVLAMLSMSIEFNQIQVRDAEEKELLSLEDIVPCDVKGRNESSTERGIETHQQKVNILLQGYISRRFVEDFALVSDMAYVAQNGARIIRALLEIAISKKWATVTAVLMGMSKAIEKRLWPYDQPLKQFVLKPDVFYALETWADDWAPAELASLSAEELGKLIHMNEHHGKALLTAVKQFPTVKIHYNLRPLGSDVLKICVQVERAFIWNTKVHGSSEPFWLWVEDHDGTDILQLSHLLFRQTIETLNVDFVISIPDGRPSPSVTIRFVSDRWMGAEDEVRVSLETLTMPVASNSHTPMLDIPFLAPTVLRNPVVESIFANRLNNFNAIQSQVLWTLINTQSHALLCAPTGSGKTTMLVAVVWSTIMRHHGASVMIVVPSKCSLAEITSQIRIGSSIADATVEIAKDENFLLPSKKHRRVLLVSASLLLDALSRRDPSTPLAGFDLVVCEDLERLDATYELSISLLLHATQTCATRFVCASNSLNDPGDLAAWLNIDPFALHSFRPRDRGQSLTTHTQTFSVPQSAALFKAMAKPAHAAIRGGSKDTNGGALVFVPSRAQCRVTARDLITQCALETETEAGYLPAGISQEFLDQYRMQLRDGSLIDYILKGVGFFHEGIRREDRHLMMKLYAEGVLRVLIVPRESCWSVPVRAGVVVVLGTQYFHAEDGLKDYDVTELVHMQGRAVRHLGSGEFYLFCQGEAKDTLVRFLNDGLPLESRLLESDQLAAWYTDQTTRGRLQSKQDMVDVLSFTFLAQRISTNPAYYDCSSDSRDGNLSRIVDGLTNKS